MLKSQDLLEMKLTRENQHHVDLLGPTVLEVMVMRSVEQVVLMEGLALTMKQIMLELHMLPHKYLVPSRF